ncbi:uncharacterized protein NDAI_0H02590 [Naumovozyma dairenensis CBS 421]|uniref:Myosin motor domain-containing protein n=1 Tax=Naumovozyma dairenensis (strain ATCC 10597 / BCRC 20456 / CBS 421 / NBRC 0211 / NRRL Y-12639) TaxID=1071378 RepID=G0WF72_NAUDC|nr:hypothetical protein NDAI_0H02590 [Naumovozyma dairenensis CBS 421]CCD26433.1 hypothetical protein NDAI_0H02590 [Naumovozyma dairenensis CBS 421]
MPSFEVGTRCWLPDEEKGWVGCEVTKNEYLPSGQCHLVLTKETGETIYIETTNEALNAAANYQDSTIKDTTLPVLRNPPILEVAHDLTFLSYLNEPAVLHAIKQRYAQNCIYTYSGIVLIAINPFANIDELYTQEMIQQYARKTREEMVPHIFAIAEEAFREMSNKHENQTIIVSGESGAGKTVTAKYIMRFFASVEEDISASDGDEAHQLEMSDIEKKILATNPIMEAFGNAKTTRNDNSSRFGKYLQILFDSNKKIIGSKIKTYLLERSRLVYQPKSERNYHIFYQLLKGLTPDIRESLHLTEPSDYFYLNQGESIEIIGMDDIEEFNVTSDSLSLIGFTSGMQFEIFKVLAALLHIGNIEIKKTRNEASVSSEDPHLIYACELLGIDPSSFAKWIVKKQINTRSEKIISNLNFNQACVSRDSVAKFIYSGIFNSLVENINTVLCNPDVEESINSFIGVLDIYGFEHFEQNSFEQFCINYANEKLQQEFNKHVFKLEQEEYIQEEIEWSFIEFNDNQPCIDLIENRVGILSLLDEESRLPSGSDESWTEKLYQTFSKPPTNSVFGKPRFHQDKFIVSHYANDVTYDVEGFIEKNRDTVSDGHLEVLNATTNSTLKSILELLQKETIEPNTSSNSVASTARNSPSPTALNKKTTQRKNTLGFMFKKSLVELMQTINETNVHYIRCIKPNSEKEAWKFDNLMVLSQLRACGVLETIRISCAGFPSRWTFDEFGQRYYFLTSTYDEWNSLDNEDTNVLIPFCKQILNETIDDVTKYQVGNTKIFFKAGILAFLEKLRSDKLNKLAIMIQNRIRMKHYRYLYLSIQKSIRDCQKLIRGYNVREDVAKQVKLAASILIQTKYRSVKVNRDVTETLQSITSVQSQLKGYIVMRRIEIELQKKACTMIQKKVRSYKYQRLFKDYKRSSVVIQSHMRRKAAVKIYELAKKERNSVGHLKTIAEDLQNEVIQFIEELVINIKENKKTTDICRQISKEDRTTLKSSTGIQYSKKLQQLKDDKLLVQNVLDKYEKLKDFCRKELKDLEEHTSNNNRDNLSLEAKLLHTKKEIKKLRGMDFSQSSGGAKKSTNDTLNFDDNTKPINDELVNILTNETSNLIKEAIEGMLPHGNGADVINKTAKKNKNEILYFARTIIIILDYMSKLNLTDAMKKLTTQALMAIEELISSEESNSKQNALATNFYWLNNVHEIYGFIYYISSRSSNSNAHMKNEIEQLQKSCTKTYLKLYKNCSRYTLHELKRQFNSSSSSSSNKEENDAIKEQLDTIYIYTDLFGMDGTFAQNMIVRILEELNTILFNDLLINTNRLTWEDGYQIDLKLRRIFKWCDSHEILSSQEYLNHICQSAKLLQLRLSNLEDFKIVCEFCYSLTMDQIHTILAKYTPTEFEQPIPKEIMNYISNILRKNDSRRHHSNNHRGTKNITLKSTMDSVAHNNDGMDQIRSIDIEGYGDLGAYLPTDRELAYLRKVLQLSVV